MHGYPVEGFDLGNSPAALTSVQLSGKRVIQRTTAGTQGVVRTAQASHILVTGLCTLRATVREVRRLSPDSLTLVQTGVLAGGWGDEDVACADLIEAHLAGKSLDMAEIERRVRASRSGRHYDGTQEEVFPAADLEMALAVDRFDFAMAVKVQDGLLSLRPVR